MATYTTTQRPSLEFPEGQHKEIILVLNKHEAMVLHKSLFTDTPEDHVHEHLLEVLREAILR